MHHSSSNFGKQDTNLLKRALSTVYDLTQQQDCQWEYKDQKDAPQVAFEIYADEFAQSTFNIFFWANDHPDVYDVLDPFKSLSSMHNVKKVLTKMGSGTQYNSLPKELVNSLQFKIETFEKKRLDEHDNSLNSSNSNIEYLDFKLIGHGEIQMNRFFSEDVSTLGDTKNSILTENKFWKLTIWHHGVNIGHCNGQFIVQQTPFFRQMYAGVRSEKGTTKANQIYRDRKIGKNDAQVPKQVKFMMHTKSALEDTIVKLYEQNLNYKRRMQINGEIQNLLKDFKKYFIRDQEKDTHLYKNEDELLLTQNLLIDIAKYLLEYADQLDEVLRGDFYENITLICNRDELDLSYMGFEADYHDYCTKTSSIIDLKALGNIDGVGKEQIYKKIQICINYQTFLYQTLEIVFNKLEVKGINEKERQFVDNFCAIAYFRIPEFRKIFLDCLKNTRHAEMNLDEWHDKNREELLKDVKYKFFIQLFNWERDFYPYIQTQQKNKKNIEFLNILLEKQQWQKRFQKGTGFFTFLSEWCKLVDRININHAHVPWEILPGYNDLMRTFLREFKYREAKRYPDSLKQASCDILNSTDHLNVFLRVIYRKTNVYHGIQVFFCYEMINLWFQKLIKQNLKLPTNFQYHFFFQGCDAVFDDSKTEHVVSLSKVIFVLYNNYQLFPAEAKKTITDTLLSSKYFKFFMHWSKGVRQVFHHMLIFRIYHNHRQHPINLIHEEHEQEEGIIKTNNREDHVEIIALKDRQKKNKYDHMKLMNETIILEYSRLLNIVKSFNKKLLKFYQQNNITLNRQLHSVSLKVKLMKKQSKHKKQIQNSQQQSQVSSNQTEQEGSKPNLVEFEDSMLNSFNMEYESNTFDDFNSVYGEVVKKQKHQNIDDLDIGDKNQSVHSSYESLEDIMNKFQQDINDNEEIGDQIEKKKKKNANIMRRDRTHSFDEIQGTNNHDKDQKYYQKITHEISKNQKKLQKHKHDKNLKNKAVIRYDHDNKKQKLEIQKKHLKYMPDALAEFQDIFKEYEKWVQSIYDIVKRDENMSLEDKMQQIFKFDVPELKIKVPKDESEKDTFDVDAD